MVSEASIWAILLLPLAAFVVIGLVVRPFLNLESMMIVAAIMFCIGLYGSLARRNVLVVLMSLELMFNGVNLTLVALAKYVVPVGIEDNIAAVLTGQVFAVFIITVAAAEVALGLGIVFAMYRNTESVDLANATELRN